MPQPIICCTFFCILRKISRKTDTNLANALYHKMVYPDFLIIPHQKNPSKLKSNCFRLTNINIGRVFCDQSLPIKLFYIYINILLLYI